ncbi:MliC family protein [Deinococcus sp.]
MPQVRSASGVKYQNSEWTWFSQGQEGFLEFRGKKVAQNCRSQ